MKKIVLYCLMTCGFLNAENISFSPAVYTKKCIDLSINTLQFNSSDKKSKNEIIKEKLENIQYLISNTNKEPMEIDIYEEVLQNYNYKQKIYEYISNDIWFRTNGYQLIQSLLALEETIKNYNPKDPKESLNKYKDEYENIVRLTWPSSFHNCF